jgi:tight adherence protein B
LIAAVLGWAVVAGAAESASETIAAQSVSVSAWPNVTMRIVLPPNLLAAPLASSDFAVRENGAVISSVTVQPLESARRSLDVILLIDVSGSMKGKPLDDAKAAASSFVTALGPNDRVSVMRFSDRPSVVDSFTSDGAALGSAVGALSASGATSLYDALTAAAQSFDPASVADRAVVLLSDGGDTTSGNTLSSASKALVASSVHVYAVAVSPEEPGLLPLRALARSTGGRLVEVGDTAGLTSVFADIAKQITRPYEVTFTSLRPPVKDLEIDVVVSGRDGRATVSAVVANPDVDAAAASVTESVPVPAGGWPLGIAIAVFAAVGVLAASIALLLQPEPNAIGHLKYYEQLRAGGVMLAEESEYTDPASVRGRLVAVARSVAARGGFDTAIRKELERAGLPLRPAEYMILHVTLVLVLGLGIQLAIRSLPVSLIVVLFLALGPILLLSNLAQKRMDAFQAQLPDVLNLLSGSLRAGWGLLQAAGMVVNEIAAPAGPEFERVVTEARLGLPLEDALAKMADRMGSEDFRWAVTAISIQREVGGNLAEVLDLVADTVRERGGLQRQIKSLTAEGRLSAIILIALPFVEATLLWIMDPGYFGRLVSSPIGVAAAIGACVLLLVGIVWLRAIIRIEV